MSAMLLSIKPQYAKMIIEGTKKYEFRTRKCREDIKKIIFYATAPKSQVVGEAEIEDVLVGPRMKSGRKQSTGRAYLLHSFENIIKIEKLQLHIN